MSLLLPIGKMAHDTSRSRKALTGAELAEKDAKGRRLSLLDVKAGERIRTADVQLGKPIVAPQLLIHAYVMARFLGHFKGFNWFASH